MYIAKIPKEYQEIVRARMNDICRRLPNSDSAVADRFLFEWHATLEELLLEHELASRRGDQAEADSILRYVDSIVSHNIIR